MEAEFDERVTVVKGFYSDKYSHYRADLICSRHVLEHIKFPREFLLTVRQSIGNRLKTSLYFEVPNGLFNLKEQGIFDIIYEHNSYFSKSSLSLLFDLCGFEVLNLYESYTNQFLCIEASPCVSNTSKSGYAVGDFDVMVSAVMNFSQMYQAKIAEWQHTLDHMANQNQRVVIWGGGSKGVTFLNTLKTKGKIEYAVDINPNKQGKYVPGTGQQFVGPAFLPDYQPDVIIVMNDVYMDEIKKTTKMLGLSPDFRSI